jgi:glycosyltransferase involved in cell wall biosynthesis
MFLSKTKNKNSIITNGVNIKRINTLSRSVLKNEGGDFKIVSVGRLIKLKNHETQIKAFRKLEINGSRLIIIGEGPEKTFLTDMIKTLGLDGYVKLTGLLKKKKLYEYLIGADLFISTSKIEGLPYSVLEAMACRCAIVLSDIAPHREIAKSCGSITLVSPENFEGFAEAIAKIQSLNDNERLILGEQCRTTVKDKYTLKNFLANYNHIYQNVLK